MIDLDPKSWKNISVKFKIKDNGLDKALSAYEKLEDDAHDDCLKTIAAITQLANALKKAKDVAAAPEAVKYLTSLSSAADKEKSDVAKAKLAADKAQEDADKAQITADKAKLKADEAKLKADKAEADAKKDDDDDDDHDEHEKHGKKDGLKSLMISMLQKVKTAKPDAPLQYLICDAKPFPVLMIARQINAGHRKLLEKESGGSKRFLKPGHVTFEDGHFCFASEKNFPGYARKLQGFLKNLTGKKFPVMFGGQKATDDDDDGTVLGGPADDDTSQDAGATAEAAGAGAAAGAEVGDAADQPAASPSGRFAIKASVGQGGKNQPEDVSAVQTALNARAKAGLSVDGKCTPAVIAAIKAFQLTIGKFKPDGLIDPNRATARALASGAPAGPPPEPLSPVAPPKLEKGTLEKAPNAWRGMHGILGKNIGELKRAVRSNYGHEHPTLKKDIEAALKKLDAILESIGPDLADHLAEAHAAKDAATRKAKLQHCKALVAKHIMYVKAEPMIAHIDRNPFGVATNFQRILTDHLVHVAQAIGNVN